MQNMVKKLGSIANGILAHVKSAGARLVLRILREQNSATRVVGVTRSDASRESRLVYDLSVLPHQCYLANGLLVSNSDAFQVLAVGLKQANAVTDNLPAGMEGDSIIGLALDDETPIAPAYEPDYEF